jgi:hypothetical protein
MMTTWCPAEVAANAAESPAKPAPMTRTRTMLGRATHRPSMFERQGIA